MIIRSCTNAKFVNFWKSVSALGLLFVILLLARIAGAQCTSQFTAPIAHGAPPPTLSGTVTFTENYNCTGGVVPRTAVVWYGSPDSGNYLYNGQPWQNFSQWPPPPFTGWPNGFLGPLVFPLSSVTSNTASFKLDTTQLPGTQANSVPYDINFSFGDANGNYIGGLPRTCTDNPAGDCDITFYVANGSGSTSASSCTVTEQSPTSNALMSGTASPIAVAISCNGPYDHAKFAMGDSTNTHFGVASLPFGSSSATLNSMLLPNGPYASAVGVFNDAAETQLVGWFAGQKETISNTAPTSTPPPTSTPQATSTPAPTSAPTPAATGVCRPDISSLNGVILTSPVSVMPAVSGCSSWPGAHGFVRFEQTKPWPIHYDGNPGSPFVTVPFGPAAYAGYVTLWLNSVTPIGSPSGQVFFTVSAAGPSPTQVPPTPTPLPPTPTPAPTPTSCQPSLTSPAQLSTVGSPVTFMASAFGCNNWPGASGFLRIEQTSPYPIHYDGNPGSSTTITPLAAGAYRAYATLWLNSVTQIGVASPSVNFTIGVVPASTATPSPTPSSTPTPPSATPTPAPSGTFTINAATKFQTMMGFGEDIDGLPTFPQSVFNQAYNQFPNGIGLTFARLGMTWDGSPQGPGSTGADDGPWTNAQEVVAAGGQAWTDGNTAPAAWKQNNSLTCGGVLLSSHYQDYANEILDHINTAKANGVQLYGFSVQNEPEGTACGYESMNLGSTDMLAFVKVLCPTIAGTGVRIMLPETQAFANMAVYQLQIESDPTALACTSIYTTHQYGNGPVPPSYNDKPIWETEWFTTGDYDGSINGAMPMAQAAYDAITTGNVSEWGMFWLATPTSYGNDQIIVDNGNGTYTPNARYYVMGNFSAFVRPGYVRVAAGGGPSGVEILAFVNPANNSPVMVLINNNGSATNVSFSLQGGANAASVTPYITSSSLNLAQQSTISVSSGSFSYVIPGFSVTTLVGSGTALSSLQPARTRPLIP